MEVARSEGSLTVLVHEWVTGGGLAGRPMLPSWADEGRAMRRALAADFASLARDGVRVIVTLDERLPDDPGPWTIERIKLGEQVHRLRALALAADATVLVAPETAETLARVTHDLRDAGARVLGSSPTAIDLTGDKARLAAWLSARGIRTPTSWTVLPEDGLPPDAQYPAVLKPVDGAGCVDTFYVVDARSLPAGARRMSRALLQPFVAGVPMSASFLVDGRGTAWLLGVGIQRIAIRDGRFAYQGGTLPAPSRAAEAQSRGAVAVIPGLRGFVGVDFVWDPEGQRATVLEINPRPTTSCVGLTRLLPPGRLAEAWLRVFEPEPPDAAWFGGLADRIQGARRIHFDARGDPVSDDEGVLG